MGRYVWLSTPTGTVRAMGLLAKELEQIDLPTSTGTVRAMGLLAKELKQIDLLAETSARRPDPRFLVIDEVGPLQSSAPGPTPRFAQLSNRQRQRSR